jgi:protein PhnA
VVNGYYTFVKKINMSMNSSLSQRSSNLCELCTANIPSHQYTVSPKSDDNIENQVALCDTCNSEINNPQNTFHWRCLEGSIWNPEPSVQALSYRLLKQIEGQEWAENLLSSVDIDESVINWALSALIVAEVHKDAFGNTLKNGDNVVLTQALNVKGTSFTAAGGTVVKRIKLVHDNIEQIEGKINDQTIVILTKFVKKQL